MCVFLRKMDGLCCIDTLYAIVDCWNKISKFLWCSRYRFSVVSAKQKSYVKISMLILVVVSVVSLLLALLNDICVCTERKNKLTKYRFVCSGGDDYFAGGVWFRSTEMFLAKWHSVLSGGSYFFTCSKGVVRAKYCRVEKRCSYQSVTMDWLVILIKWIQSRFKAWAHRVCVVLAISESNSLKAIILCQSRPGNVQHEKNIELHNGTRKYRKKIIASPPHTTILTRGVFQAPPLSCKQEFV